MLPPKNISHGSQTSTFPLPKRGVGFELTVILKNQKMSKNDICRLQDSISGPLACKSNALPLGYASL